MGQAITLERANSADADKRWRLLLRVDGLYSYEEESIEPALFWLDKDGGEREVAAPARWARTYVSGIFQSAEAARADALTALPWLASARESRDY